MTESYQEQEPDLDEPGAPRVVYIDGVPREIEQTKRDNCVMLAEQAGGEVNVTPEMLDAHPVLTRRDYGYWILDLFEHQQAQDFRWEMLQRFGVAPAELPETYVDRFGLRHLKEDAE